MPAEKELLKIAEVAQRLRCSSRHIRRLIRRRAMPAPVRVGALLRWEREVIEMWIRDGCPVSSSGSEPEESR